MLLCILCLKKKSNQIKTCSKKAQELNCSSIIAKHFWLQPSSQKNSKESICLVCWNAVNDFHKFYQSVAEAHNYLESEDVKFYTPSEDDGFPKPKKEPIENSNDQLFDVEVKLEINELDNLPGTEVIENVYVSNDCSENANNTNLQQTDVKENSNTDIKKEPACHSEDDSDSEIPLAVFLQSDLKIGDKSLNLDVKDGSNDVNSSNNETSLNHEHLDSKSDEKDRSNSEVSDQLSSKIVPKRLSAKQKSKRKHTKTTSSKETTKKEFGEKWLQQRLQQEKYDEIIAKLFDEFPCRICKVFVRNFGDMRNHFKLAHKGSQPSVECCERKFHKRLTLADHVLVHLNPEHFKCSKCGQILKDSITLKEHEESHDLTPDQMNEKKTFECHICSQKLSSKYGVEKHILIKHVPKSEYKIPCEECKKMFPTKHLLKKHVRETHRGSRSVICEQCGKTLQTKYILKKHIEHEHLKIPKPEPVRVQCTICQLWLRDIYSLRIHMQCVHAQTEGEHRCDICGALSVNALSLKRHISYIHKLERKFQCSMCEKAFRRAHELKEHTSTHTGEVLFSCAICSMMFASKASLYKHRRKEHGHQPKPVRRVGLNKEAKEKKPVSRRKRKHESEELNTQDNLASEEADTENILSLVEPNMKRLSI